MFYPSYKRVDRLLCFVDHKSPHLERSFSKEPSFLHLQGKNWNLHSFSVKEVANLSGKIKFQIVVGHAFSNAFVRLSLDLLILT